MINEETRSTALSIAEEIGQTLADEAIWHEERCTWIGPALHDAASRPIISTESLGPSLYEGTAGIAWFLAELAVRVENPAFVSTARAAMRHALSRAPERHGLYTGTMGVALSAVRVGQLLGHDDLVVAGAGLADQVIPNRTNGFDLLGGDAGLIIGLLGLSAMLRNDRHVSAAVRVGEALLAAASVGRRGYSWKSPRPHRQRHLLGLSHGTAGAALAFLRLFETTRMPIFAEGAREAIRYENGFFDASHGNWPDLRWAYGRGLTLNAEYPSMWCHGAPGIAISRLHANHLLEGKRYERDLENALVATRQAVDQSLAADRADFSLCHGLTGNAEVLMVCANHSETEHPTTVARRGFEAYSRKAPWPCGLRGAGPSPGLFLGLAGIGHFYLRVHDSLIPSVLDVNPASITYQAGR